MTHPYQSHREKHPGQKKAAQRVKGYATGGSATVQAKAKGGAAKASGPQELKVGGVAGKGRLDKLARGGKAKGHGKKNHTNIHINVAPKSPDVGAPVMPPPDMGAAGAPPPGPPMGAPMGGPPGQPLPPPMKRGGMVKVKGGDNGVGRLDKKRAYGLKPIK